MKIFHLSDLHLCKLYKRNNIVKTRKLLKHFVENKYDHLVITGDISDNGKIEDWLILRKLLLSYGIYNKDKVSITIGNHDIYGGVQTAVDILSFPARCLKTDYFGKVKQFYNVFSELFTESLSSFPNLFPILKIVDDVAFILINTIDFYGKIFNPFASNGKVSTDDFRNIYNLIYNPVVNDKVKIILSHHHFYKNNVESTASYSSIWNSIEKHTMKLRGKKKLIKLFSEGGINYVMHGHSHELKTYERKKILFSNSGASTDNLNDKLCSGILLNTTTKSLETINIELNTTIPVPILKP
ncbi:MAG TPA: metallophosphoesterase, partial [Melioribacteraceae bacterium]|nr:metallophosphoesterase [Melioribacteraceae bacterium]